jgi:hypothetical protein
VPSWTVAGSYRMAIAALLALTATPMIYQLFNEG